MMINLTREEAQQVLDALEDVMDDAEEPHKTKNAFEFLRAKLSEPEPEPVATQYKYIDAFGNDYWTDEPWEGKKVEAERYLYTAPPQREWVDLTREEIAEILCDERWQGRPELILLEVHARLKEKNNG